MGSRLFVVMNGATVDDPSELTVLKEYDRSFRLIKNYSDFSELKELIASIEARWESQRNVGR
jgi:hypothetical protein